MPKRTLAILCLVMFLVMLGFGIIIPNLVYYIQTFQDSPDSSSANLELGILMAAYSAMQFLFTPFWGRLSDRHGRKPIILTGLAGSGATLILFGLATSMPMLFGIRTLAGFLSAAALPTVMAYAADISDERSRGHAMGLIGASMGLGFIFGPAIGGVFSQWGGEPHYEFPFFLAGGLSLLTIPIAAVYLTESLAVEKRRKHRDALSIWNALRHPLSPLFLAAFMNTFVFSGAEVIIALLLHDRFGGGAHELGIMLAIMGAIAVGVQGGMLGRLIHRFGEFHLLVMGILLLAAGMLLAPWMGNLVTLTVAVTIAGLGSQLIRPTNASWISKITPTGQGIAMGMMDSFLSLGRIGGPIAASALYGWNMTWSYLLIGSALLAALGLLFLPLKQLSLKPDDA